MCELAISHLIFDFLFPKNGDNRIEWQHMQGTRGYKLFNLAKQQSSGDDIPIKKSGDDLRLSI